MPGRNQAEYKEDRRKIRSEGQPKHQAEGQPKHISEERPKHISEERPRSRSEKQPKVQTEERSRSKSEKQPKSKLENLPRSESEERLRSRSEKRSKVESEEQSKSKLEKQTKVKSEKQPRSRPEERLRKGSEEQPKAKSEKYPKSESEKKKKGKESEEEEDGALSLIGTFLSTFVTVLIVAVAAVVILTSLLGWSMFSIDSYSMEPNYPYNSLVLVQNVDPSEIQVGDVITFVMNESGQTATHRVVSINRSEQTFTTKGDANASNDANPVYWGNLVGKVVIRIPGVGGILRTITAQENRVWVIIAIAALLVVSFAWDAFVRVIRNHRRKKYQQQLPIAEPTALPDDDLILAEALALEEDPEFDAGFVRHGLSGAGPLGSDGITTEDDHPVMDEIPAENESSTPGEILPDNEPLTDDGVLLGGGLEAPTEDGLITEKEVLIGDEPAAVGKVLIENDPLMEEVVSTEDGQLAEEGVSPEGGSAIEEEVPPEDEPLPDEEVSPEGGSAIEREVFPENEPLLEEETSAKDWAVIEEPSLHINPEQGFQAGEEISGDAIPEQNVDSAFQKVNDISVSVAAAPMTNRENGSFSAKDFAPATDSPSDEIVPEADAEDSGNNASQTPDNANPALYNDFSLDYALSGIPNELPPEEEISIPAEQETFNPNSAAEERAAAQDHLSEEDSAPAEEENLEYDIVAEEEASAEDNQWKEEEKPESDTQIPSDDVPKVDELRIADKDSEEGLLWTENPVPEERAPVPAEEKTDEGESSLEEEAPAEGAGPTEEETPAQEEQNPSNSVLWEDELRIADTPSAEGLLWRENLAPEEGEPVPAEEKTGEGDFSPEEEAPTEGAGPAEEETSAQEEQNPSDDVPRNDEFWIDDSRLPEEDADHTEAESFKSDSELEEETPSQEAQISSEGVPLEDGLRIVDMSAEEGSKWTENPLPEEEMPVPAGEEVPEYGLTAEEEASAEADQWAEEEKREPDTQISLDLDDVSKEDELRIVNTSMENGFMWTDNSFSEVKKPDQAKEETPKCDPTAEEVASAEGAESGEEKKLTQEAQSSPDDDSQTNEPRIEDSQLPGEENTDRTETESLKSGSAPEEDVSPEGTEWEEEETLSQDAQISLDDMSQDDELQEDDMLQEENSLQIDHPLPEKEASVPAKEVTLRNDPVAAEDTSAEADHLGTKEKPVQDA